VVTPTLPDVLDTTAAVVAACTTSGRRVSLTRDGGPATISRWAPVGAVVASITALY
jgi:hypothetical protein